jgi:hypothetical protein
MTLAARGRLAAWDRGEQGRITPMRNQVFERRAHFEIACGRLPAFAQTLVSLCFS